MAKNTEKQTYTCVEPIKHDGDLYKPGDDIELALDQAAQLLELGHVREKAPKKAEGKGDQK